MDLLRDIAAARTGSGLSQQALAEKVGVSRLAITRLENEVGSIALLLRVMAALDFRVSGVARGGSLPEQLQARRKRLGITVDRAAAKANLDPRTLRAVEEGRGNVASLVALLRAVAPRSKKSDPPRASWNFDATGLAERDKRFTPSWFLDHVVEAFGSIDLDPCGHHEAAVEARRKIILPDCGLASSWAGHDLTFINPPFSAVTTWIGRAADAFEQGEVARIVMLVPVRTDSPAYQTRASRYADTLFLAGRMRFESTRGLAWPAPFSLMLLTWGATEAQINKFIELVPAVRMRPWDLGVERDAIGSIRSILTNEQAT